MSHDTDETSPIDRSAEPIRVLLVDDQLMMAETARRMLAQDPSIELVSVRDGAAALTTAKAVQPNVILQDLIMPGIDGLELLKSYRQDPTLRHAALIVLSTREDPVTKKACFEAGANDYLVKLPDVMELLARVRLHAQVAHQQAQLRHALQALQEGQRALLETNAELQREMAQRKQAQQALAEVQAQMDALTNVNVSVSLIAERLRGTPMMDLPNVAELLRAHESDLGAYFTSDPVGQQLPGFLDMLAQHWTSLQEELTGEVGRLRGSVEQLKDIVSRQQRLG